MRMTWLYKHKFLNQVGVVVSPYCTGHKASSGTNPSLGESEILDKQLRYFECHVPAISVALGKELQLFFHEDFFF